MSSFRNAFSSKAQGFQTAIDKYRVGEKSFAQISKLFNDFILFAKESVGNEDENEEDIQVVLDIVHTFLKNAIDYAGVGSVLHKLIHFRLLCSKIFKAIDYLEMIYYFLKKLSIPIFEILLEADLQTWIAKEILKMYCVIVHNLDRSVRKSIVKDNFSYYMSRFMDLVAFGDYEFQVLIVELIFRMYSNEELQEKENIFFFKTEEQKKAFYSIDTRKFDFSLRLYLNLVNDKEKNVISVLCHKVCLDEFQLREPDELSAFQGLWIDFNIKVGTITFYINNRDYCDMVTADDTMWEIVTIFSENISNAEISIAYNEEKGSEEAVGKLKLKDSCLLLNALSQKLSSSRTLTLCSTNVKRLREIFHRDIPKMTKKIKTKQVFTSLNRRGFKPLDIISIKSSTTNHSSSLNHTFNTEIGCKNLRNADGKKTSVTLRSSTLSEKSVMDFNFDILNTSNLDEITDGLVRNDVTDLILDKGLHPEKSLSIDQSIIEKLKRNRYEINQNEGSYSNETENVYEEAFMSQLMNIEPDSPKSNGHWNSSHEAFETATETPVRTEMIRTDKSRRASEYGEKFLSGLLQMDDLKLERRRSASYGKASKAKSIKADVPSLKLKKKAHSLSCQLDRQLITTEPDSPKSNVHSNSSHEAFETATMTPVRSEMIRTDKSRRTSEYGEKFLSGLLQMEDLKLEGRRSASYGKASKAKSIEADSPSLKLKKKAHSLSCQLDRQMITTQSDSPKSNRHSNSSHEAFETPTETPVRTEMIRADKSRRASEYGEKILSGLLQTEDLKLERLRSSSYKKASKTKSFKADVPSLKLKKNPHSLSCQLDRQLIATEPDSTTMQSNQSIKDSELLLDDAATSERSALLSSDVVDIPSDETLKEIEKKNRKRKMSAQNAKNNRNFSTTKIKIPLAESNVQESHQFQNKNEKNLISEDEIDKSKSKNRRTVSVSIINCSPQLYSSQIEIFNNDENEPPNSLSVKKTRLNKSYNSKVSVFINSLENLEESPDPIRDVQTDPFDDLKSEIPKRQVELPEDPKIDTFIEGPNLIEITGPELGNIVSENTEIFETARTDLDGIEIPESQHYFEKSQDFIKDLSQEEHLKMSIRSTDDDSHSNIRPKIKILTNIRIQSSFDKVQSKSSIHSLHESKNQEMDVECSEGEIFVKKTKKIDIIHTSETMNTPLDETQISQSNTKSDEFNENHRLDKNINIPANEYKVEKTDRRKSLVKEISHYGKRKIYENPAVHSDIGIQDELKKSISEESVSDFRDKHVLKLKTSSRKNFIKKESQSQENVVISPSVKSPYPGSLVQTNIDKNIHIQTFSSSPKSQRTSNKTYIKKYNQEMNNSPQKSEKPLSSDKIYKVPYVKLKKLSIEPSPRKTVDSFDSADDLPLSVSKEQLLGNICSQNIKFSSNNLKSPNFIQEDAPKKENKAILFHQNIFDENTNGNIEDNRTHSATIMPRGNVHISESLHLLSQENRENVSVKHLQSEENVSTLRKKPKLSHKANTSNASIEGIESNYFQNEIVEKHSQQLDDTNFPISDKENMISNVNSQSQSPKKNIRSFESIAAEEIINQESISEDQIPKSTSVEKDIAIIPAQDDIFVSKSPISQKKGHRRYKNQDNEDIQSFAEEHQNEVRLSPTEEIDRDNNFEKACNNRKICIDPVSYHSFTSVRLMTDDNSQAINVVNSQNSDILFTDSNIESNQSHTRSQNIGVSAISPNCSNSDAAQSSVPSKQNEMKEHVLVTPEQNLLLNIPSSELQSTKQSQCMQITNTIGSVSDTGINIFCDQTETKTKSETNSEKYDLSDEIEKSMSLLFGAKPSEHSNETFDDNLTKNNIQHQNGRERNITFDASNPMVISKTAGKLKRGKLYDPNNPEETLRTLPEFMEISKENEIIETSFLKSTSCFESKQQLTSKLEIWTKLKKRPRNLSETENKKRVANTSVKTKKSTQSKNRTSIKNINSKNDQQNNYKGKGLHTKQFRRLDILIDNVFERLKSPNYSTRTSPSITRLKKCDNNILGKKYNLDLSLKRVNEEIIEKNRESGEKYNVPREKRLSAFSKGNKSTQNSSKGEAGIDGNISKNDRDLQDFMTSLGRICATLGSEQLTVTSSFMKRKFIAMSQLLSDV